MTKTQLGILWGLGVLVMIVLGALGWALTRTGQPNALSPTATPPAMAGSSLPEAAAYRLPEMPYSARNLYGQAAQAAQRWQPDAALASASASWPFASLDDFSKPSDWTFQFYSSATGRIYVLNADQTTVTPIRETLSPYRLPVIDAEQWQIDSHQALNTWLNRGGGAFLKQTAIVDVSIRLSRPQEGVPMWTVVGIDDSGQIVQTERIDALQGTSQ